MPTSFIPQLCACGCGEYAAVDEGRKRVSKYRHGHNMRVQRPPQPKRPDMAAMRLQSTRHGHAGSEDGSRSRTPTYISWQNMHARCRHPSVPSYKNYGGRGIKVCGRWQKFENFLADLGERPEGMTLDRIDPDGNYEPGNCRWATGSEQRRNQRQRVRR